MILGRNTTMALQAIRANRSRSIVTALGVIIAVTAVTTVVSIGSGIQQSLARQANQYSENVITVRPKYLGGNNNALSSVSVASAVAELSEADTDGIAALDTVEAAVPLQIVGTTAKADAAFNGVVFAAGSDLSQVLRSELEVGAYLTSKDSTSNMAVLGADAAEAMFDQNVPLGRSFTVRGQEFIVAGVLSPIATTPFANDANFNKAIFVPESSAEQLTPGGAPTYELLVKASEDANQAAVVSSIKSVLKAQHGSSDDFSVLTPSELAVETTATFSLITYLIVAAAIIILLVSGVGIMNVMLVSVTERTHEIGIRKAIGATNRQIMSQFVAEAATLCAVGSALGAILSFLTVVILRILTNLSPQYEWKVALLACAIASVFGVFFGTLPAIKAARKDPITALRGQ